MEANSAKTRSRCRPYVRVTSILVAFDRVQLLDVAGPLQAFATADELDGFHRSSAPYRLTVVSSRGGEVTTSSGLRFIAEPFEAVRRQPIDTLIVAGG